MSPKTTAQKLGDLSETVHFETTGHRVCRTIDTATSVVVSECWTLRDEIDRPNGPAEITRDEATGMIVAEEWARAGNRHRIDGPAVLERDPKTGIVTLEEWFFNGDRWCRPDAPCLIERHPETGTVIFELWGENDQRSRADGPALIWRGAAGEVVREEWWTSGRRLAARQHAPYEPFHGLNLRINRGRRALTCC